MSLDGLIIGGLVFSVALIVIAVAALVIVTLKIQEERAGSGCRSAGCRRSRAGNGCTMPRAAEPGRGETNWRE